ncbi:MAG: acyl carrier protein [Flavobacteriales bacterium]
MVTLEEFTRLLEKEFDDIDTNSLSPKTSYRNIPDFSSMHALVIIAFIDNQFDVLLTGEELKNAVTIEDLYNLVKSKTA